MTFIIRAPETVNEFKEYYHFRWLHLRKPWGEPEGSEQDEQEDSSVHIMAVDEKSDVKGVCRLDTLSNDLGQIRYMAVASEERKTGLGTSIMKAAELIAMKKGFTKMILHSREGAVGFYLKNGYSITEKSYLLFNQIQHFKMEKELI